MVRLSDTVERSGETVEESLNGSVTSSGGGVNDVVLGGVKVSRHVEETSGIGGEKHESGGSFVSDLVVTKLRGKVVVLFIVIRESDIFVGIGVP